ncbi:MAG: FliI/YscN family ATPase [Acidobacteria bacterium]|nr:FliI/YscN family ATPase [Acidobacteriota bacterium]
MALGAFMQALEAAPSWRWSGRVVQVSGQIIESEGPLCSVGDCCEIISLNGSRFLAEIVGFRGTNVLSTPLQPASGIRFGDRVLSMGHAPKIRVGDELLGRVVNGEGIPIDGMPPPRTHARAPLHRLPPSPMERAPIRTPLSTGIRAIDGMLTTGQGQRVGIFGGSGVGKSTLIGMMTRNTSADVTVVGLIGERGREVREFLEDSLGEEGLRRSVTVVSTSDETPLQRMRAAMAATAIAEHFRDQGKNVLLVLDSLTRYCMAAREVGLAAGEPPSSKGYTPSVFAKLAQLVERAGNSAQGSITAFYTVLMEGDDQQDPIVDAVRSMLDGHIVLSRQLAGEGVYPPIDILDSLSRLMSAVAGDQHKARALEIRRILGAYSRSADMVRIGAYKAGSDAEIDLALRHHSNLRNFFLQSAHESLTLPQTVDSMLNLDLS